MAGCSPFNVIDNTENLDQEFSTFCKNLQAILTKSDEWLAMWKEAEQKSMEEHEKAIASYEGENMLRLSFIIISMFLKSFF